jgi:surfactin synthase thioesterase subunit
MLAVQYPGRQDRRAEKPIEWLPDIADAIFRVRDAWAEPPFAFLGHSMGAVVAFEVARRLAQAGEPGLVRLFASGRRAPSQHRHEGVHGRDDAGLVAELRRVGGTDSRFLTDAELLTMILPAVRSDYRAIETYVCAPGPLLTCPVTVLLGDADPKTTVEEAAAWREHTAGECDLKVFPGGHFFLDAQWNAVAKLINSTL